MGLRCLLGHDFDEPELQREREEDGDEVVTTVREVKTCARCGETQIVSENTEVTTMEQLAGEAARDQGAGVDRDGPAEPTTAPGAEAEPAGAGAGAEPADPGDAGGVQESMTLDEESGGDDAVILDDGAAADADESDAGATPGDAEATAVDDASETDAAEAAEEDAELLDAGDGAAPSGGAASDQSPAADAVPDAPSEDEHDAETDDGVILDADDDESVGDRGRGEWPEVDEGDAGGDGAAAWPDHGGEDEGFSAEVGEGGDAGVEFGGGLAPEAAEQEGADGETEYVEAPDDAESVALDAGGEDAEGGTGITRGESPELQTAGANDPTEYYCPECGMVRTADGSSMRAGDICPECKRGYVDERPQ